MMTRYFLPDLNSVRAIADGEDPADYGIDVETALVVPETIPEGCPFTVVEGEWIPDWGPVDAQLHARIDRDAGAFRLQFLTIVPGQEMTYQDKAREARAWMADAESDPANYPYLAAEAAATEATPGDVAASILGAVQFLLGVGSAIEAARVGSKRAVTLATTLEAKEAAAAIDWTAVISGGGS